MTHRTVSALIDDVTQRLGDSATIVSRAEIKDWIVDGYSRMIRDARTPCQLEVQDVPPRFEYAVTYEWERQYIRGTTRKFTYTHYSGRYECTSLAEASGHFSQTVGQWQYNVTHLQELAHISGGIDSPYVFSIPRRQDLLGVWYDGDVLLPVAGRQLEGGDNWWDNSGLPSLFTTDYSHNTFDLYRIVTSNNAAYTEDRAIGTPRAISGSRTYAIDTGETWGWSYTDAPLHTVPFTGIGRKLPGTLTADGHWDIADGAYTHPFERDHAARLSLVSDTDFVTMPIGAIRNIISADRQYHNSASWQRHGTIRSWGSSVDNLLIYAAVVPERNISEGDTLGLVPAALEKYVVFYALSMVHGREGELYEPNMAEHYRMRYGRGVALLGKIRNVAYRDVEYSRGRAGQSRRLQIPQLPDNYPRLRIR